VFVWDQAAISSQLHVIQAQHRLRSARCGEPIRAKVVAAQDYDIAVIKL